MLSHLFIAFHMVLTVKKMMWQTKEQRRMKSSVPWISLEDTTNLPHAHTLGMKKYMENTSATTFTPACIAASTQGFCSSLSQLILFYQAKQKQIN